MLKIRSSGYELEGWYDSLSLLL